MIVFSPLKNQDVFQRQAGNSIKSNIFITFVPFWKLIKVYVNTFVLLTNTHTVHISFFSLGELHSAGGNL
jgi:hypothetical protein